MTNARAARDQIRTQRYADLRESTAAIQEFFDRVGPRLYAACFGALGYRASLRHLIRAHRHRLALRDHMATLDAGIGTGFLAVNLLRESPVPLDIVGLDFSRGMVTGLRRWLTAERLESRVKLTLADLRRIPFPDETFDLVITSAAMEYLPEVGDGIAECARVLKPSGKFLFIATRDSFIGKVIAATWKNKLLSPAYVTDCMRRAGMRRVDELRFPWYFPHVNAWGMALLGQKAS